MENNGNGFGTSVFWIMSTLLATGGLIYLMIEGFHSTDNSGIQKAIIASIFLSMILFATIWALFTQNEKIMNFGTFGAACLSFTLGFLTWLVVGTFGAGSVLSVSQNSLFSEISSQLPLNLEFVLQTFVIPFSEEMFWMIAIPIVIISLCMLIGKNEKHWYTKMFGTMPFQIALVAIIAGVSFAAFHVGKYIITFLIAAILFRWVLTFIILASKDYNIATVLGGIAVSFSFGAHVGNNWASFGFMNGLNIIFQYFTSTGWIVIAFLLMIFIGAGYQIAQIFSRKGGVPQ